MKKLINDFISSIDTKLYDRIRSSNGDAECRRYLKRHLINNFKEKDSVIECIEEYAPKPLELPKFDPKKKGDHVYCVEWGMKKAKRNEYITYQKMLKELKDKHF